MSNKNNIDNEIVDLNTKVDMFINWYYENMITNKNIVICHSLIVLNTF